MASELRENQTRETQKRRAWTPSGMLDTPEPPEGYHYRWVRHELKGVDDTRNVVSRFKQGYEPVTPKDLPSDFVAQVATDGVHAGAVINGDLILCKVPIETVRERKAYYRKKAQKQQDAVNHQLLKDNSPLAPIEVDHRTSVSKGNREMNFEE